MNPLALFRRDHAADEAVIEAALSGMVIQPERTLLETSSEHVQHILHRLRADETKLVQVIEERQERLRQTRISIEAFTLAEGRLSDG